MRSSPGPATRACTRWPGPRARTSPFTSSARRTAGQSTSTPSGARSRPRTRLIVINGPHNPTGMLPDRATFDAVVAIAAEAGAHLLSDEVYRYLEFDEADRLPAGVDAGRHVVSLGVMSKSFALAGLRIGWLASRDRSILDRVARLKDYTTICSSAPSEILALIGLRARDRVLARSRSIVIDNVARLDDLFARWPGVLSWVRPRGGSIGFPRLRSRPRHRAIRGRARRGRGRPPPAWRAVRPPGQSLPDRLRASGPARCRRGAGAAPRARRSLSPPNLARATSYPAPITARAPDGLLPGVSAPGAGRATSAWVGPPDPPGPATGRSRARPGARPHRHRAGTGSR